MTHVYMNSDPGAPQLSGQPGSLVALLDAVLVDGYGVGTERKSPAGWTREIVGVNKRSYRNSPANGTGFFLEIDDTASVGSARYACARGYASMSEFGQGTLPTPSPAQRPNGVVIAKSSTLDGDSRRWLIIADDRMVYLFVNPWPADNGRHPYFFGDFNSYKPGDASAWCICEPGMGTWTSSEDIALAIFTTENSWNYIDGGRPALYLPSSLATPGASSPAYLVGGYRGSGSYNAWGGPGGSSYAAYPDPVSQGLLYNPVQIFERALVVRGELPGIVAPVHLRPFPDLARQVPGAGLESAESLLPVTFTGELWSGSSAGQQGQVVILEGGGWWR